MQFFFKAIDPRDEKLINACMDGNIELVKELIEAGANINGINPDYGDTGLSQAAFKGHDEIVTFLLTKQISLYSKNCALILACQAGREKIVDQLLKKAQMLTLNLKIITPHFFNRLRKINKTYLKGYWKKNLLM